MNASFSVRNRLGRWVWISTIPITTSAAPASSVTAHSARVPASLGRTYWIQAASTSAPRYASLLWPMWAASFLPSTSSSS
jgi:hypothetical protein